MPDKLVSNLDNYELPSSEEELTAYIDLQWSKSKSSGMFYERQWYLNLAYLLGRQWLQYNDTLNRLFEQPVPSWRIRLTSNIILPVYRILKAKILAPNFVWHVIPANRDEASIGSSKVSEAALTDLRERLDFDKTSDEVVGYGLTFGSGFFKPYFDISKGDPFEEYQTTKENTGHPHTDPKGLQFKAQEDGALLYRIPDDKGGFKIDSYHTGSIQIDSIMPFELATDVAARKWKQSRHVIQLHNRPISEVREYYNRKDIEPDQGTYQNQLELSLMNLYGSSTIEQKEDAVLLKEYWEKPTKKFPQGRLIIAANGKILDSGSIPKEYLKFDMPFPHVKYDFMNVPTLFWGKSLIEDLRPLQKEYNRSRSQIIEHKNLLAKGKLLVPFQANVPDNAFTSEPGERIPYLAPHQPTPLQIAPLPSYVFANIDYIRKDVMDISGIQDVTKGKNMPGLRSGNAINALQQQDDSQLGPSIKNFTRCLEQVGDICLSIMKERYTEKRTIRITGKNMTDYVKDFMGADINPNERVYIKAATALPTDKALRQQIVIMDLNAGLINKTEAREYLEIGNDDIIQGDRLDERMANVENEEMSEGIVHVPQKFQNPLIHIEKHNDYRNTTLFESFDDKVKMIFDLHVQAHIEMLSRGDMDPDVKLEVAKATGAAFGGAGSGAAQGAAMQAGVSPGGPGGPPPPPMA